MARNAIPESIAQIKQIPESNTLWASECFMCGYGNCDTLHNVQHDLWLHLEAHKIHRPTLTAINTAILNDKTLSEDAKHALIELMRVAYEEVVSDALKD